MSKKSIIISVVVAVLLISLGVVAYDRVPMNKTDDMNYSNNQNQATSTLDNDMKNMDGESFDNDFNSIEADIKTY